MKIMARLSFLLITALWGSFYAITKEALGRIDPVMFTFLESMVLVPIALTLLIIYRGYFNTSVLKRGILRGSWLCLALLTIAVSLKFTQATSTAFFPSIGGIMGALITGFVLKRPLKREVWIASGLSLIGISIILEASGGGIEFRGDLIAFLGALFFTVYIFLVDHDQQTHIPEQGEDSFWLVLGVEHLTVGFWMMLIVLLFGDWQNIHLAYPKDIEIILYISLGATFVPFVLSTFMQRYIDPLEVAFISILEPVWGVIIAYVYLGETSPAAIYLGGTFVIAGTAFHLWSTSGYFPSRRGIRLSLRPVSSYRHITKIGSIGSSMLLISIGFLFLSRLGGSLPDLWNDIIHAGSELVLLSGGRPETASLWHFTRTLLWLVAWGALIAIGVLTAIATARYLLKDAKYKRLSSASLSKISSQAGSSLSPTRSRATRKLHSAVAQRRQVERERRLGLYFDE